MEIYSQLVSLLQVGILGVSFEIYNMMLKSADGVVSYPSEN